MVAAPIAVQNLDSRCIEAKVYRCMSIYINIVSRYRVGGYVGLVKRKSSHLKSGYCITVAFTENIPLGKPCKTNA